MKATNYFKPNWKAINKAIAEGGDLRKSLNEQLNKINKLVKEKSNDKWREDRKKEADDLVKSLKALPVGSPVWYTGTDLRIFGKDGYKVIDRRKYMVVSFPEATAGITDHISQRKNWIVLYHQLVTTKPGVAEVAAKRALVNILNH